MPFFILTCSTMGLPLNFSESLQLQRFKQSSLKVFSVVWTNNFNLSDNASNNQSQLTCDPPSSKGYNSSVSQNSEANSDKGSSGADFNVIYILFALVGVVIVFLLLIFYLKKAIGQAKPVKNQEEKKEDDIEEMGQENEREDESDSMIFKEDRRNGSREGKRVVAEGEEDRKKLVIVEDEEARWFELHELLKAPAEGLGKGIFGNTYKANLQGRASVVVKRLRDLKPLSTEEYTKQLQFVAQLRHPNLLPLVAYYFAKEEKLLVYKFAQNGSLFDRIHGRKGTSSRNPFRWSSRLSVAGGVARALEYLHVNTKSRQSAVSVPHGNLKSSNVLLDENETVLVSDYGFASLVAIPIAAQRMVSYKSPEYQNSKQISRKSDIWSYGCLLLELLTGRVSVHSAPPGINGVDLCSWVLRAVKEEWTAEIFDSEISVQRSAAPGMLKLLQLAIKCCHKSPEKRPAMTEVVRQVENIEIPESAEFSSDQSVTDESLSIGARSE